MKKFDFGDGWTATMEQTETGLYRVVMDTDCGQFVSLHKDAKMAMAEILSYFVED